MKLYDVTLSISEDLPTWPGDPGISMTLSSSLARGDAANVTRLDCGVHTGTHMDAPFHFEPDGVGVDQISLDVLMGPCRVVDVTQADEAVSLATLRQLDLGKAVRILFKTRNSGFWGRGEKRFQEKFVYIAGDAAKELVERGVKLVGVDYLSIEKFKSTDHITHHLFLRNGVAIIEGLNLSRVPAGDYELIALPMKLQGADGAPMRVVLREK